MKTISKSKLIKNSESFTSVILCLVITLLFLGIMCLAIVKSADRLTAIITTLFLLGCITLNIFIAKGPLDVIFKLMKGKYKTNFAHVFSIKKPFPPCASSGVMVLEIDGGFTIGISDAVAQKLKVGDEIVIVFVEDRDYPAVIAKKDILLEKETNEAR